MAKTIINSNGVTIDFEASVRLMDEEIREKLHRELAPCTEQKFFAAYAKKHRKKFGEEWELDKTNPVW